LVVGNGTGALNVIAPNATTGIPLISNGVSADPGYGTAVVAGGGTGDTSFTAYSVITGGTTSTGALQNVSGVGTTGQVLTSNGASALPTWQTNSSGSLTLTAQRFTSSGAFTYTPTAGTQYVIVELLGAGGGSGGTDNSQTVSGGGGGGAYAKFILSAAQIGASLSGSVGAGGTAGTSGSGNGGNGGNTTLATASPWTAGGGAGSLGAVVNVPSDGGAGGTVTTGTGSILLDVSGQTAYPANGVSKSICSGGSSLLGFGPLAIFPGSAGVTPIAGNKYGAGASGAGTVLATPRAGAAGANGIAIFTEFQ
jgi:hypothetical protein